MMENSGLPLIGLISRGRRFEEELAAAAVVAVVVVAAAVVVVVVGDVTP